MNLIIFGGNEYIVDMGRIYFRKLNYLNNFCIILNIGINKIKYFNLVFNVYENI